jgi:hypothetical protein
VTESPLMAIWQRLNYEHVASFFLGRLYWRRFAHFASNCVCRKAI